MVGNKRPKLAAVDTDYGRRPETPDERAEERQWRAHVRRERSSAYWFAATKWGILGLVVGAALGGAGMYFASTATLDLAQDAVTKGAIVERLRQEQERQAPQTTGQTPAPVTPSAP